MLLSLGAERYEANFSRNGSTAEGYIIGVETGLYQVKVSDQGSSVVVITSEISVTQESLTNGSSNVTSSMVSYPTTVPGSSSTIPSEFIKILSSLHYYFNDSFTRKCVLVYV